MRIFPLCGGMKTSGSHLTSLTTKLKSQREMNSDYCDIRLICGSTQFSAHRTILVAASPYFECLIEGNFAESKQNDVDLTEAMSSDPDILQNILDFIYTGKLLIEGNNFRDLLDACSLLLLNGAIELLSEYLRDSLVIINCLEIFEIAFKYSLEDISQVCISMINSRAHDYFCHGERFLSVPPEIFIHLYKQNILIHMKKIDLQFLIKQYIQNLKDLDTEISQETVKKLYQISEEAGISDITSILGKWMDKEHVFPKDVPEAKPTDDIESQSNEILVVRCKESKWQWKLFGWLDKASKWINMGSVNGNEVGFYHLGRLFGFAENYMAFEIRSKEVIYKREPLYLWGWDDIDIALIPLDPGDRQQARTIKSGCDFCLDITQGDYDRRCPHSYFTAWNELYCVGALVEVRESEGGAEDYDERFRLGYEINKYSVKDKAWYELGDLEIPDGYYYDGSSPYDWFKRPTEVAYVEFKVVNMKTHVLLVMVNLDEGLRRHAEENYLTIVRLTAGDDTLKTEVIFHTEIKDEDVLFYRDASITVVSPGSSKLRFQKISEGGKKWAEVDFLADGNGSIQIESDNGNLIFPKSDFNYFRPGYSTEKFVTSGQNGHLHHIDNVLPYINRMWSYDPMKNEWNLLPGPPAAGEEEIIGANIQNIPEELVSEVNANPAAVFEDTHESIHHGPFHGKKISN